MAQPLHSTTLHNLTEKELAHMSQQLEQHIAIAEELYYDNFQEFWQSYDTVHWTALKGSFHPGFLSAVSGISQDGTACQGKVYGHDQEN